MSTTTQPLTAIIEKARGLIKEEKHEEAVEMLLTARKENTEGASAEALQDLHYSIGLCFNELERESEALPHLRKALKLAEEEKSDSGQARTLEQLGTTAYKKNEHRGSLALYQKALGFWKSAKDKAGQARCLRDIGSIQSDLMDDEASEKSFDEAKELFRELEDEDGILTCVTNVGLLHYRQKGPEGAIKVYEDSFENDKIEHYLLHNNMGFLHLVEERTEEARTFLLKGQKDLEERGAEDDNAALLYLNLGIVEALEGNDEKALEALGQAETLFEKFPQGRAVEVVMCANKGHDEFARFILVEDADKRAIAKVNRGAILAHQGKTEEAIADIQAGMDLDRNLSYPHYCMGWVHLLREDKEEASRSFKRATGMEPNNEVYASALKLSNPYLSQKVGRNEPCPCGSGKKFKKCHGKS